MRSSLTSRSPPAGPFFKDTHGAAPHDWLSLTGGAIGEGPAAGRGARRWHARTARSSPCRRTGPPCFPCRPIWTIARETAGRHHLHLGRTRAYAILKGELAGGWRSKAAGMRAQRILSLADPPLDWVKLAARHGRGRRPASHPQRPSPMCSAPPSGAKGPFPDRSRSVGLTGTTVRIGRSALSPSASRAMTYRADIVEHHGGAIHAYGAASAAGPDGWDFRSARRRHRRWKCAWTIAQRFRTQPAVISNSARHCRT